MLQCTVVGLNAGFTTYRRTENDIIFTQEAVLITAHGKTCDFLLYEITSITYTSVSAALSQNAACAVRPRGGVVPLYTPVIVPTHKGMAKLSLPGLEFNGPFQHKYGYIRHEPIPVVAGFDVE